MVLGTLGLNMFPKPQVESYSQIEPELSFGYINVIWKNYNISNTMRTRRMNTYKNSSKILNFNQIFITIDENSTIYVQNSIIVNSHQLPYVLKLKSEN